MNRPFFQDLLQATEPDRQKLISLPIIQSALRGEIEKSQYLAFLTEAYHHVRHTVPLLMACGSRLDDRHHALRTAVVEYIEEEAGHEEWILADIAACGGNPDTVRLSTPHASTEVMVAYAYHQIDRQNPVGFFGMVHVLEGTSVALATHAAGAIQHSLQLPDAAFTYLTSHGSLDQEHVRFFENLMNALTDPDDKAAVIHCAERIYSLYGEIFRTLPGRISTSCAKEPVHA